MSVSFPIPTLSYPVVGSIPNMCQAVDTLGHNGPTGLANATVDVITSYYGSPVEKVCKSLEALYADACYSQSTTSDDAKVVCYQLADFATFNGWWGYGSGRGMSIQLELRRQLGDPSLPAAVSEANRPAVDAQYDLDKSSTVMAPVANAVAS